MRQLESFSNLCLAYERSTPRGEYLGDAQLYDQLHRAEPTVRQILRTLDPQLAEKVDVDQMAGEATARHQVQRALGILADLDEWAVRLAPDAPTLVADRLHPWIWDAARTFWDSRHYRAAVHAAASSINAHTQAKLRRTDVADGKVMQEALSDKPAEAGEPRLRVAGDPASPTLSRRRGVLHLGLAAFFPIRNPAAHDAAEWTEHEALEQLAVLSVLARFMDVSSVRR